jgi:hypothetical protein
LRVSKFCRVPHGKLAGFGWVPHLKVRWQVALSVRVRMGRVGAESGCVPRSIRRRLRINRGRVFAVVAFAGWVWIKKLIVVGQGVED